MTNRLHPILFMGLFFLASAPIFAQSYRVLLSNDDGIESPLLHTLAKEIAAMPGVELVVAAPRVNQSGSSHSMDSRKLSVEPYLKDGVFFGHAVSGRPSDAVRYGLRVLGKEKPFDLVISGINRGSNVGIVSHLSGTIGAAMEAAYNGVPAIAVSEESRGANTQASAKFVAQMITKYQKEGAPEGVVLSVNIPAGEPKGVAIRPMGEAYVDIGNYQETNKAENKTEYQQRITLVKASDPKSDTYAYQEGYITVTPLKFDWTDYKLLKKMKRWDLKVIKN